MVTLVKQNESFNEWTYKGYTVWRSNHTMDSGSYVISNKDKPYITHTNSLEAARQFIDYSAFK